MTRRGRRGAASSLVTIKWRDIPAQVNAGSGDERCQRILPRRFQKAIDRAAMVAGKRTASEYVAEWHRTTVPFDGEPETAATAEAERLEAEYPRARLDRMVETGGWDPDRDGGTDTARDESTPERDGGTDTAPREESVS